MLVRTNTADLLEAMAVVNRAAPTNQRQENGHPVWLIAEETGAFLAWDEWGDPVRPGGEVRFGGRVSRPGAAVLSPTRPLRAALRKKFPDGAEATIAGKNFSGGGAQMMLGRDPDGYRPWRPAGAGGGYIRFAAADLREVAERLLPFSYGRGDESHLRAFGVSVERGVCRIWCTDKYRMAADRLPVSQWEMEGRTVMPSALVRDALRLRPSGTCEIAWTKPREGENAVVSFSAPEGSLYMRWRIPPVFPYWRRFMCDSQKRATAVLYDPAEAAAAIRAYASGRGGREAEEPVEASFVGAELRIASYRRGVVYPQVAVGRLEESEAGIACLSPYQLADALEGAPAGRKLKLSLPLDERADYPALVENRHHYKHLLMPYRR